MTHFYDCVYPPHCISLHNELQAQCELCLLYRITDTLAIQYMLAGSTTQLSPDYIMEV
jgi:hypothetical protein